MNKKQQKLKKQLLKKEQKVVSQYDQIKVGMAAQDEFSVANLIGELDQNRQADKLQQHYNRVSTRAKIVQEPEQKADRDAQERKVTAIVMKQNVKKWLPIVKKNREADHIDFTKKKNLQNDRINSVSDALKNNPIAQEIEQELKKNKLSNEDEVKQRELKLLEAKQPKSLILEQQNQIAKKTSLAFFQELKNKRISKIKSKIYHRIKKRRSERDKIKLMAQLNPIERQKEMEKLKEERAKERITLRHSTKSKFTQKLMRFGGDKKSLQQQQNYLNQMRSQLLKKAEGQFDDEDGALDDLDDDEFKTQAIQQLEQELLNIAEQEQEKGIGLKFLEKQRNDGLSKSKSQVLELIKMLRTGEYKPQAEGEEQEEIEDDRLSWEDSQEEEKKKTQVGNVAEDDDEFVGRSVFKKQVTENFEIKDDKIVKRKKKIQAEHALASYLQDEQEKNPQELKQQKEADKIITDAQKLKEIKEEMKEIDESQRLLEGLNIRNLKSKYKQLRETNISKTDDQILRENLSNFVMHFDEDENENTFLKEKLVDLKAQIPDDKPQLKGWGSWAGFGIKERKAPSQEDMIQRKIRQIKEIQKKRKDTNFDNAILSEKRDTAFSQYLVTQLPYEFQTKEQFDYMHVQPLGPEWNSFRGHQSLIKPRIITKAGSIINAVRVPQKTQNKQS